MSLNRQRLPAGIRSLKALLAVFTCVAMHPVYAHDVSDNTPLGLRGIWYPKSAQGAEQCAQGQKNGLGELLPGALQITHTQLLDWKNMGQPTMVFVTESRLRKRRTWRLQGLVDVYPYEEPKVLETYIFELKKNELRWFKRSFDVVAERVDAFVYERCL